MIEWKPVSVLNREHVCAELGVHHVGVLPFRFQPSTPHSEPHGGCNTRGGRSAARAEIPQPLGSPWLPV